MLHFLGIHEGDINSAEGICEAVCEVHGLNTDEYWTRVRNEFIRRYGEQFSNTIIRLFFDELKQALVEKGIESERIDYEVNGFCSDFYIDEEQAY